MSYKLNIVELKKVPRPETFLTKDELKTLAGFKLQKRRDEWLAGRYALKSLAERFFSFNVLQMEVKNDSSGLPRLVVPGGTTMPVSITHSGIYAAAAVALNGDNIGLDIEAVERRWSFRHRSCHRTCTVPESVFGSRR